MKKKITAVILALTLCFAMSVTAFAAADTPSLDPDRTGSISLTLYSDEAEAPVSDGVLTLYQVADLILDDGNMAYVNAESFAAFEGELDADDAALAGQLADYVAENGITGTEAAIGEDGSVVFSDLTLGMYLIVQTEQSTGYYTIAPFLVTVPMAGEDGWIYDVDATPKTEVFVEPEIPEEPEPEEPEPEEPEPTEPENPTESETPTEPETPATDETLPQTGQLNWPIPLLAAAGVLLVVLGMVLTGRKKKAGAA